MLVWAGDHQRADHPDDREPVSEDRRDLAPDIIRQGAGDDRAEDREERSHPQDPGGIDPVEADIDHEGELVQRDEVAAEAGEQVDREQQPEMWRAYRLGEGPIRARQRGRECGGIAFRHRAVGDCRGNRVGAAEQARQRQHDHGHQCGLQQIGRAPADPRHPQLHERRRHRPAEPVGRLEDRDRHAAPAHEMPREDWDEHDQPEAIRPDRHHHPIKDDDLPQRRRKGADREPEDQQPAAEQRQPARSEPVDERPDKGRAQPGHQLRHRIGHRGLGSAPAELLDKGDEIDRIGMHQPGADRERRKGAAKHQPGRADAGPPRCRVPVAHHRNLREIAPRVTHGVAPYPRSGQFWPNAMPGRSS